MNDTLVMGLLIVAILLGAVGTSGMIYNFQNTPEIETTESFNWRVAPEFWEFQNDNFVSEGEWKVHNEALTEIFDKLDKKVDGIQGSVTLLRAQGDVTTQPIPAPRADTVDFQLKISDNKFATKSQGYPRDVPAILITGQTPYNDKTYLITIEGPSGSFVKDEPRTKTLADGDISDAWIPKADALPGTYIVRITMNLQTDSIEFILN